MSEETLTITLCAMLLLLVLPDPIMGIGGALALALLRKGPIPDAFT